METKYGLENVTTNKLGQSVNQPVNNWILSQGSEKMEKKRKSIFLLTVKV